ncbi:hypothetical protein ACHAXR_010975 [Thalassiosira sp. AJA248-18]
MSSDSAVVQAARPSPIATNARPRIVRSFALLGIAASIVVNLGLIAKLTLSGKTHAATTFIDFPTQVRLHSNNSTTATYHWDMNQVAIVNFVDNVDHVYGVYSIHQQIVKHNISAAHVVIVNQGIQQSFRDAMALWIGDENLRLVNTSHIIDRMSRRGANNVWKGVFNKLWAFNLTEFDKVIMLDADILIRTNIQHWFDYPTPCAIQSGDDISWNSGAMVITPDSKTFEQMLSRLPGLKRYNERKIYHIDPFTGGHSDQEFVTAFFLGVQKNANNRKRCVMPTEAAVLSSSLKLAEFSYVNNFHPWVYDTVHFTVDKPWKIGTHPSHPFVCSLLREWNETMRGVEKYYALIPPIKNDYLQNCGVKNNYLQSCGDNTTEPINTAPQNAAQVKAGEKILPPGERCTFCKGGIPNLALDVPQTGGNTCCSIKLMAAGEVNGSDVCTTVQKEERVCCPGPIKNRHI